MDAGRWLAVDRGAFEGESVQSAQQAKFPLADRLTEAELAMIWQFREGLQ